MTPSLLRFVGSRYTEAWSDAFASADVARRYRAARGRLEIEAL